MAFAVCSKHQNTHKTMQSHALFEKIGAWNLGAAPPDPPPNPTGPKIPCAVFLKAKQSAVLNRPLKAALGSPDDNHKGGVRGAA